jgi:ABC-type Na+ transport system ATPase subunit NatA
MVAEQGRQEQLPERWSGRAICDVVLRLFRGEAVDAVSREVQAPVHELEGWRRAFLEAGIAGLKARHGEPEDRALKEALAKVGELTMKLELAELLLEKRIFGEFRDRGRDKRVSLAHAIAIGGARWHTKRSRPCSVAGGGSRWWT